MLFFRLIRRYPYDVSMLIEPSGFLVPAIMIQMRTPSRAANITAIVNQIAHILVDLAIVYLKGTKKSMVNMDFFR